MPSITVKEATKFYKKDNRGKLSDKVIMKELKGSEAVVYGARSVNAFVPAYLKKHTEDWDIYVADDAKTVAGKIEKALDKRYGSNFFSVEPAKHEGTYKVKSRVTGRTVADITIKEDEVKHRKVGGINYTTLDFQAEKLKKALEREDAKFRHERDKETLQRINVYKSMQPKKKVKKRVVRGRKVMASLGTTR